MSNLEHADSQIRNTAIIKDSVSKQRDIIACYECDKIFKTDANFFSHLESCQPKVYNCEICLETFSTKGNLKKHCRYFHDAPPDEEKKCPFCEKAFKMKKSMKHLFIHIKSTHYSERENDLFKNVANEYDLYRQRNGIHCDQCGNLYSCPDSYSKHIQNIHGSENILCSECAEVFKNENNLKYHMITKHSKVTLYCEHCGHLYKEKRHLDRHIQTVHLQVKKYKCNLCNIKFADRFQQKLHNIEVHEKLKPFKCLDCEYRTARYGNLNLHRCNTHGKQKMPKPEYDELVNCDGSKGF